MVFRFTRESFGPASEYDPVSGRTNANQGFWVPDQTYNVGDVVFADNNLTPGWDAPPFDGVFDWLLDSTAIPRQSLHIAYRCVATSTGATSGTSSVATLPAWQSPGLRFTDNDLIWEGFNNFQPLKSVRLTIRFIEPNSEQPKQLTLIMPMTDDAR